MWMWGFCIHRVLSLMTTSTLRLVYEKGKKLTPLNERPGSEGGWTRIEKSLIVFWPGGQKVNPNPKSR
jgi:hypothetical protein